jgi:hypothetical protein
MRVTHIGYDVNVNGMVGALRDDAELLVAPEPGFGLAPATG